MMIITIIIITTTTIFTSNIAIQYAVKQDYLPSYECKELKLQTNLHKLFTFKLKKTINRWDKN